MGFGKKDFISLSKSMMDLDFQKDLEKINCRVLVLCGEKDKANMKVTAVEISPAKTDGYDIETGRVLRSPVPDEYDIKVTMSAIGTESDSAVKVDGVALRVGQNAVLSSRGWAGSGYAIGLSAE